MYSALFKSNPADSSVYPMFFIVSFATDIASICAAELTSPAITRCPDVKNFIKLN